MKRELLLPFGTLIAGFIVCAFGATTTLGNPVSTICVVLGLGLSVSGFIAFILVTKRNKQKSEKDK